MVKSYANVDTFSIKQRFINTLKSVSPNWVSAIDLRVEIGLSQSLLSQYAKKLIHSNSIEIKKSGRHIFYRVV